MSRDIFEETKLKHIHVGDQATIHIVGEDQPLTGHVEGLSAGIYDRERTTAAGTLLANVNPTFSWIRLAQRIRLGRTRNTTQAPKEPLNNYCARPCCVEILLKMLI